ncbi:MAG: NUDIX domain-containing protein [Nanoarchaeota archaeon]|nr:NUDIX domain-containing protein [Nanoarchaeota archaeon]
MGYDKNKAHYVSATAILVKGGKYLICKRADWEKAFPGRWTVPGGKLEVLDYALRKKDTSHHWYNVIEDLLKKEIGEEVGLGIENFGYVTSMVYVREDNVPCLILSLYGDAIGNEVRLCSALTEYAWVSLEEARNYDLIEGIYEELKILDRHLKSGEAMKWTSGNVVGLSESG